MVRSIYNLWDMVFVICIGIIWDTLLDMNLVYVYFVRHGVLKIYEKYVWVFCEECVYKIYGNVK